MNKLFQVILAVFFIMLFTSQPPQVSYSQPGLKGAYYVDTVSLFEDVSIAPLLDSTKNNIDLLEHNSEILKDGTATIVKQTLLIKQQTKIIDELEKACVGCE